MRPLLPARRAPRAPTSSPRSAAGRRCQAARTTCKAPQRLAHPSQQSRRCLTDGGRPRYPRSALNQPPETAQAPESRTPARGTASVWATPGATSRIRGSFTVPAGQGTARARTTTSPPTSGWTGAVSPDLSGERTQAPRPPAPVSRVRDSIHRVDRSQRPIRPPAASTSPGVVRRARCQVRRAPSVAALTIRSPKRQTPGLTSQPDQRTWCDPPRSPPRRRSRGSGARRHLQRPQLLGVGDRMALQLAGRGRLVGAHAPERR